MNIFARENIGRNINCRLEKDGEVAVDSVRWTHAMKGSVVSRSVSFLKNGNSLVKEISAGWTVTEVGV